MFWTYRAGIWIFTEDKGGEIKSKQPSKIFPTLILFLSVVEPTNGESRTIENNRNRNDLRIDSVQATGDCFWEIEDNDGDFHIADPEYPIIDMTYFDIATVYVYNSCPGP